MDIRPLSANYAVSPQIDPCDMVAIKAAGYVTVISNRPDAEIPPSLHTAKMAAAAAETGLEFVANPVISRALTMENIAAQAKVQAAARGPILAYCASGNRSSIVWALSNAGRVPLKDLLGIPAQYGYDLEPLRPQLQAMAEQRGAR